MKYNLSKIMTRAWAIFRKAAAKVAISFAEALHRAWQVAKAEPINAKRIEAAKAEAGIAEEVNTWAGWQSLGQEVVHGSKALFRVLLLHPSKGDDATYTASFFSASQVVRLSLSAVKRLKSRLRPSERLTLGTVYKAGNRPYPHH